MHTHGPHQHHEDTRTSNRRALGIALGITAAFLVVEAVGAVLTNSLALLADAAHMLTDVGALVLALFAFWVSSRPATSSKTYGYYRVEILAALLNGAVLFVVAAFIAYEAISRFGSPPEVNSLPMLGVASAGLVANLASAWVLSRGERTSLNLRAALFHVVGDVLGSIGVIVAAVIMFLTGYFIADPIISILISVLVLYGAWQVLREAVDVLLEGTPANISLHEVASAIASIPGVTSVHDLHVWTVTSGFVALSVHVVVSPQSDPIRIVMMVHSTMHRRFRIAHTTVQPETARFIRDLQHTELPGQERP
ncbi:MAG: cation diffusion facilitator family transporter [Dehalococcoidales bacterium]|nr:cation diffusion facilitator family transporter [Dehalococcoidales bacterium]